MAKALTIYFLFCVTLYFVVPEPAVVLLTVPSSGDQWKCHNYYMCCQSCNYYFFSKASLAVSQTLTGGHTNAEQEEN